MKVKKAKFIKSSPKHTECPNTELAEFAFVGRSNVGKSTLINMLTNKKSLAKTSAKPGKTQLINHFLINDNWFLVDLPGYGFAKSSKSNRKKWQSMITDYISLRKNLAYTFILIDSRLDLQDIDLQVINWFGEYSLPFGIVYTKTDKLSKNKLNINITKIRNVLFNYWEELPMEFFSSIKNNKGKDDILDFIDNTLKELK